MIGSVGSADCVTFSRVWRLTTVDWKMVVAKAPARRRQPVIGPEAKLQSIDAMVPWPAGQNVKGIRIRGREATLREARIKGRQPRKCVDQALI